MRRFLGRMFDFGSDESLVLVFLGFYVTIALSVGGFAWGVTGDWGTAWMAIVALTALTVGVAIFIAINIFGNRLRRKWNRERRRKGYG